MFHAAVIAMKIRVILIEQFVWKYSKNFSSAEAGKRRNSFLIIRCTLEQYTPCPRILSDSSVLSTRTTETDAEESRLNLVPNILCERDSIMGFPFVFYQLICTLTQFYGEIFSVT